MAPEPSSAPGTPADAPAAPAADGDFAERSYWQIVLRQFRRNRRAVWGLRVVVALILVAIFAPFLANEKPIAFNGYHYQLYLDTYDAFLFAHADVAGFGREDAPAVVPGRSPEPIFLPGIQDEYRRDSARWEAGNPTWLMIRDNAFGAPERPMNAMRAALEEYLGNDLRRDREWTRGSRDVAWLKTKSLPADMEADLDALVAATRANVAETFEAKSKLRRDAVLQQLIILRREVSSADRKAIDGFRARYRALVDPARLHALSPEELEAAGFPALFEEARRALDPETVTFAHRTTFPALRALSPVDVLFMLAVALWFSRALWSRLLGWRALPTVTRVRKQVLTCLAAALIAAAAWPLLVPPYNVTSNYKSGAEDGSLAVSWQLVTPIRYGINENDPTARYAPPWWAWWSQRATDASADEVAAAEAAADEVAAARSSWQGFLSFLNRHHMGTDSTGRDLLTRMIWGSRISLSIGFVAVAIFVVIGVFLGALAGFFLGWVDIGISRLIEVVICFPTFFLVLTVVAFLDPSAFNIMIVIGITGWTGVARLVRGEFLRLRKEDFVTAGHALGFSNARIIFRHVLPNAMAPVLVAATFGVAGAILIESSLSFLGFGVTVPTPTWGAILSSARESWIYWWLTMFPGFAIFLTVTMYNLVGEGIRDAVDPKLRQ